MSTARIVVVLGFAAVLALLVGLLLFDAPLEYGLDCNRFSGSCVFTQRLLIRSKTGRADIGTLREAQVRVARARRGSARIMIWVTSTGPDWFFADYSSRAEAEAVARKINNFLRDPTDGRLVITRSVRGVYWLAWVLVPIVAALVVAVAAILFSKKARDSARRTAGP